MIGFSQRRSSALVTQNPSAAPDIGAQIEALLRDMALALHLTDEVKQQIIEERQETGLALAGACHDRE
jgi:hypothetical protein